MLEQPGYGHRRFTCWWLLVLHLCGDSIVIFRCSYIRSGPACLKPTILMFPRRIQFWKWLFHICACTKPHTKLESALTTLAAEYPEGCCEEVLEIVIERKPAAPGPWSVGAEEQSSVKPTPRARRAAVSTIYAIVLSECIPWRPVLKHFSKFGHIHLQERRALRGICRWACAKSRIIVGQDSPVNLGV